MPTSRKRKKRTTSTRLETVALALGGNLPGGLPGDSGPVERTLSWALRQLRMIFADLRVASLYRSVAVSPVPQPDYLNTAAIGHTRLEPEAVLAICKALEAEAGRERNVRFGPRPLDVDILLWGDRVSDRPELTLPHPRLRERRFVLEPLADIAPDWRVPPEGSTVRELLEQVGEQGVERVGWSRQ